MIVVDICVAILAIVISLGSVVWSAVISRRMRRLRD